jgi:hypothetical protein
MCLLSGGGCPGERKQPLHPYIPDDVVENIDKTAENPNPYIVGENASEIGEKSNNSAAHLDVRDADSHTPTKTDDVSLTPDDSASGVQKPLQSNIVDLPVGALPRRRKEVEP